MNERASPPPAADSTDAQAWPPGTIAADLAKLLQGGMALFGLEVLLAVRTVPQLFLLGLAGLFLAATSWVVLCGVIAWLAFVYWQSVAAGLLVACLLQIGGLVGCLMMLRKFSRRLTLPETRRLLTDLHHHARGDYEPAPSR